MGIRCADHVTPLYQQKLALTSPTGGDRSVGIVRSRTKAMELLLLLLLLQLRQVVRFTTITVYALLIFPMHAVVSAHLIFLLIS